MKRLLVLSLAATCLFTASASAQPVERSAPYSHLTRHDARYWMSVALRRNFGPSWYYATDYRLKCKKRINRRRIRCMRISWFQGDLSWGGTGSIWYTGHGRRTQWNYSYRIIRFNEYCAVLGGSDCVKKFVVK